MPPYRKRFLLDSSAVRAGLRGVPGVHCDERRASPFSLVRQHRREHPQARIVRGQGERLALGHKLQIQILKGDERVLLGHARRRLVPKILPLVRYPLVQPGDPLRLLPAIMRSLDFTGERAVRPTQFRQRGTQPARVVDQRAIGKSQQGQQPLIDADCTARPHRRGVLPIVPLKTDEPASARLAREDDANVLASRRNNC